MFKNMFKFDQVQKLEEGEKIILFLRRHWLAMLPAILAVLVLVLFPVFIFSLYSYFDIPALLEEWGVGVSPNKILVFFFAVYFLFLDFFCLVAWFQYYLDVTILTNKRLVDIEQINIFQRQVASTDLVYIQDVSSEVKGFLPSLFDYGRVIVQTAGERPNFVLENIPHPSAVARQILVTAQGKSITQSIPEEELIKKHEEEAFSALGGKEMNEAQDEIITKKEQKGDGDMGIVERKNGAGNKGEGQPQSQDKNKFQSGEIDLS